MKRWNWPTTILYIKHKKANLKQRCSKLVGKKRKAPSEGWSGGLNCPIGTGEEMHWHVPPRASGAAGPTLGTTPGRARHRDPPAPARRRSHRPESPQGSRAGYSFKKLSRGGRSPVSPKHGGPALPETRLPRPRGCVRPTPPAAPPDRAPRSAAQGNARRVDTARSQALKSD